jgi:translation initiation factor IF-2
LIDDVKSELQKLLAPEVVETEMGRLIVRGIFKTTKTEIICGGEVTKGKITLPSIAKIFRGDDLLAEVEVVGIKRGPQEAKEVHEGDMCGLNLKLAAKLDLKEEDRLEIITRETKERNL